MNHKNQKKSPEETYLMLKKDAEREIKALQIALNKIESKDYDMYTLNNAIISLTMIKNYILCTPCEPIKKRVKLAPING